MRLKTSESVGSIVYYGIDDVIVNGKRTTKIVYKFGSHKTLLQKLNGEDPKAWVEAQIAAMNLANKEENAEILVPFDPTKSIPLNQQRVYHAGYLFLQSIFYRLGLPKICKKISQSYKFTYNLTEVLATLVYGRILFPSSKRATTEEAKLFLGKTKFQLQHVYRSLDVLAESSDSIQAQLYKNSLKINQRKTGILYYDCTNFFFEINEPSGLKQYGISKEHRPNPIVQMGLFMDEEGFPLAFQLFEGQKNEQTTMKPLEKKIIRDFGCAKFVVCTDAGLASTDNRLFNSFHDRAFITVQPIKKLKKHLQNWALDPNSWYYQDKDGTIKQTDLGNTDPKADYDKVYYKERWIKENGLEQRLVVTFSWKYKAQQARTRERQIENAQKKVAKGSVDRPRTNDPRRFIGRVSSTAEGEVADKNYYYINENKIAEEEQYDGFYAVCTNLDGDVAEIVGINKRRWQIEYCFRLLKHDFRSRPVQVQTNDHILAHFLTCFIALLVYRLFEHQVAKVDPTLTDTELLKTIKDMRFTHYTGYGYTPHYDRTSITDTIHEAFGFRTDREIYSEKGIKKLIQASKE